MPSLPSVAQLAPIARALLESAPAGIRSSTATGEIHARGGSMQPVLRDGEPVSGEHSDVATPFLALADHGFSRCGVTVTVDSDGRFRAELLVADGSALESGSARGPVLVGPHEVSAPYRRALDPLSTRTSSSVDLPRLHNTLRRRLSGRLLRRRKGLSDGQIDAAVDRLGVTVTDELRMLYRLARDGELTVGTPDGGLTLEIVPLDGELRRRYPSTLFPGWEFPTLQVPRRDPQGRAQTAGASPAWVPFATHQGDELFAVDLAPGPNGHVGQVLRLPFDEPGATCCASCLTEFITDGPSSPSTQPEEDIGRAYVSEAALGSVRDAADPSLQVLSIAGLGSHELRPLADCPDLWSLTITDCTVEDASVITSLPALEHLEAPSALLRDLIQSDGFPSTICAIAVSDEQPDLRLLQDVIRHFGGVPPRVTTLTGSITSGR